MLLFKVSVVILLLCRIAISWLYFEIDLMQGRNEVRWRPGQEASLAPPSLNLNLFRSKFTVLKKVLVTLLGLFGARAVIRRQENCAPPCSSRYGLDLIQNIFSVLLSACWFSPKVGLLKRRRRFSNLPGCYRLQQFFFNENVRYPVWICRDPISLILGTRW